MLVECPHGEAPGATAETPHFAPGWRSSRYDAEPRTRVQYTNIFPNDTAGSAPGYAV